MPRVALLGLGAMGTRIGTNLLKAGFELTVYNRSLEKTVALAQAGATVALSPRQTVENADVVLSMTRDDDSSRFIWTDATNGAIHSLKAGTVAIELSTLRPSWVKTLASLLAAREVQFLDAPVVGSRPQAEAKQLIFLVGGEANTLEMVKPVLQSIGGAIHHVGSLGQGSAIKLAVNALFAVQVGAVAELLAGLEQHGIAPNQAASILGELPVTSPATKGALASMVQQSFAPMFPIELVIKDLNYALESASLEQSITEATKHIFAQALAAGLGEKNITGVAMLYHHPKKALE
jgi:3-hydroxyisobutyrate dehydrogenase